MVLSSDLLDEYLDDWADTTSMGTEDDDKSKFCNTCGSQAFQVSWRSQDFKCSNKSCGRIFSTVEKKNLIHKERLAPATDNKLMSALDPMHNFSESFDEYEDFEADKLKEDFQTQLNIIAPSSSSAGFTTKAGGTGTNRKLDTDDKLLLDRGFTVIDLE